MDFEQLYFDGSLNSAEVGIKTPIRRKIFVEEVYQDIQSGTALIRQFNYEESYGAFQSGKTQLQLLGSSVAQLDKNEESPYQAIVENHNINTNKKLNLNNCGKLTININEETPMEIDSSGEKFIFDNMYGQDIETFTPITNNILKKRNRKSVTKETYTKDTPSRINEKYSSHTPSNERSAKIVSLVLLLLIVVLTIAGVYIVIVGDRFIYINREVQIENIKGEIQESVLHQEHAVTVIIHNFERLVSVAMPVKILPFAGTTGVGKTFTANIIKKHFHPQVVHEVGRSSLTDIEKQQITISNLNSCCCNLIIIDDLKASDLDDFMKFVLKLPESYFVLIIPIFNIQDTVDGVTYVINENSVQLIRDKFDNSGFLHELVLFDVLESHVIEKWLRQELHKRHIHENRHNSLVKFLLDNNHIKYKGFKGINSKLLLALDGNH